MSTQGNARPHGPHEASSSRGPVRSAMYGTVLATSGKLTGVWVVRGCTREAGSSR